MGMKIMFDIVFNDMVDLEKELLKIGSFYVSKHEQIIDAEVKEPIAAIDRGELVNDLLKMEHEF